MTVPPTASADSPLPRPGAAAGSGELGSVISGFPGPAMLVARTDEILQANTAAQALLRENAGWWANHGVWRGAMAAGLAGHRTTEEVRPGGIVVYEWQALRLPDERLLLLGRDITLERRLRQTLTESRQRYKDLVEISSDFAWETGSDERFVFVSPKGALGFPAEHLVGRHPRDLMAEDDGLPLPFVSRRPIDQAELWLKGADGTTVYVQAVVKPLFNSDGAWIGTRGICRDLTAQAAHSAELSRIRNRERVLNRIVHALRDQLDAGKALDVAARETIQALDGLGCAIHRIGGSGLSTLAAGCGEPLKEWLTGAPLAEFLHQVTLAPEPIELQTGPLLLLACRTRFRQTVNGTVSVWRDAATPWDDDARQLLAGVADRIGITHAQLAYQEHLRHLSERDSLTGLFNRRTFLERLAEMLTWRDFGSSALLYIDLDNFKAVNDQCGHHQGDEVLRAVGELVTAGTRPGDLCGRMGGDEFVLWFARTDEAGAIAVASRLLAGIERIRPLSASQDHPLGMSIGIAIHHPGRDESVASLLERADTAMYQAKLHGKGAYTVARDGEPSAFRSEEEASPCPRAP